MHCLSGRQAQWADEVMKWLSKKQPIPIHQANLWPTDRREPDVSGVHKPRPGSYRMIAARLACWRISNSTQLCGV